MQKREPVATKLSMSSRTIRSGVLVVDLTLSNERVIQPFRTRLIQGDPRLRSRSKMRPIPEDQDRRARILALHAQVKIGS
jgi:hypothetical protein